ncbi:outer membrane receptor protein involved in Fe transport [Sphingomonas sp. SORGH_AS802]|uniref:TonB-dependent receptor n=1 Tax=unclassified Sphingomonas TaxID=196159 RepID=UPI002859AFF3|nr:MULTISPECIES: TonB-dependent receptor [unclassified Sphingomonas]MDR6129028.1 outer membrane receptor protein involved in Fe transport [Sphingomonas sp. SORGH_AS_0438]MDR6136414.1 outer membrane receptor protein involved in Fe transport [Sphingomonas sp. SORGH_AS_0802]
MKSVIVRRIGNLARTGSSLSAIVMAGLAAGVVVAPTAAFAQTATSTLRGRAPAGVEVVATETSTGSVRRTTAGTDGTYVIAGLPSGNYRVTAGDRSAVVAVAVASTAVLDLDAPAAEAQPGDIIVQGVRPSVDVRSSSVNQFVSLHDIAVVPQITRNFLEFADTVPGVQFNVDATGNTSLRGGAQLASSVNVYIDGVSQKDYVGGGSGITGSAGAQGNGDPGNPFPQLAIAEYKVITSNYPAQYGDAASTIIVAQTKSGTNQFHGEAFGQFTNQDLRARTPAEKAAGSDKARVPSWEYGAALGGPIIKDVAHFFVTWEHKSLSNQSSVYPGSGVTQAQAVALLPANVASQYGPVTNPFTENLYFGKIDIEPTAKDRFEFTGRLRIQDQISGGNGQAAASTAAPFVNNDRRADVRWQHSEDHWVNEARLSYQNTNASTTLATASPQFQYTYFPFASPNAPATTLIITGGPGSGVGAINRQRGYTFKDDLTLPNIQFAGNHSLAVGFNFASVRLTSQNASSDLANATYYYAVTPAGVAATPYKLQYPNLTAGFTSAGVTTTARQYAAYIQDDWSIDSHLTLNLGLRWDHEVVPAYLDYVTPANVVAAINGPFPGTTQSYASVLAQGNGATPGYNINDYISTGSNRRAPNNFSPRLGFSYDIDADSRHVIFGGFARSFNRNQFATLALETTKIALNGNPEVYFPSAVTQNAFGPCATAADINPDNHCYAFNPAYLTPAGLATLQTSPSSHEVDMLPNNIRTPHSDQYSLGMRNSIGDWNTQVTLSYVESFDGIVGRFANRYADGAYFQNGSPWGAQGVPGVGSLILFDNGAKDRLLQLGLGAQRPYTKQSGWSATIAYTLSYSDQNNVAGGSNPYAINSNQYLFDLPYAYQYPFLRGTATPVHRVVATYSRDLFWGIQSAAKVELATANNATTILGCQEVCNVQGGTTLFVSRQPKDFLGYKEVDLQFTKNVDFWRSVSGYVRVDLLNIFNFHNYDPAAVSFNTNAANGQPLPIGQQLQVRPDYNRTGPIVGVPFTVKLSTGLRF